MVSVSNEARNADQHIEILSHPSGWKFQSFHRHILNGRERKDLAALFRKHLRQLFPSLATTLVEEDDDDLHWDNFKLHIPPMLFGRDIMRFDYKSWGSVSVSAQDALFCWLCKHVPEVCNEHALQVIQVPHAKKWAGRLSTAPMSPSPTVTHYLTPGHGTNPVQETGKYNVSHASFQPASPVSPDGIPPPPSPSPAGATPGTPQRTHFSTDGHPPLTSIRASDWTYSTDYCCSLLHTNDNDSSSSMQPSEHHFIVHGQPFHGSNIYPIQQEQSSGAQPLSPWIVTEESTCGVDYELLRRRDMPILFYDEMTLYEDDLEDCGEISIEAKVRVMPNCWFALVRFFLRIDNALVRSRETRLFHQFPASNESPNDSLKIHAEVLWREKHLDEDATLFPAAAAATAAPASTTTAYPTSTQAATSHASPATSAVLRNTSPGAPLHPALAKVMHGTAAAAARAATTTATSVPGHPLPAAAASHLAPIPPHLLPQRFTKENASEVLPRVNDSLQIPAYYTFTLRNPDSLVSTPSRPVSDNEMQTDELEQHHHRHLHWFGLAAAHGIRR
jgi:hypothetical protein